MSDPIYFVVWLYSQRGGAESGRFRTLEPFVDTDLEVIGHVLGGGTLTATFDLNGAVATTRTLNWTGFSSVTFSRIGRAGNRHDAGLAAHPSGRLDVNGNHFRLAMLAYNLNCWLMLFNREPQADATALRHTTLATSRLRFLFVAAKIWRHAPTNCPGLLGQALLYEALGRVVSDTVGRLPIAFRPGLGAREHPLMVDAELAKFPAPEGKPGTTPL